MSAASAISQKRKGQRVRRSATSMREARLGRDEENVALVTVTADGAEPEPADPGQLNLFACDVDLVLFTDAEIAARAVSTALEQGKQITVTRSVSGFEIRVTDVPAAQQTPVTSAGFCGFSRRASDLLLRAARLGGAGLWARSVGRGWAEWGLREDAPKGVVARGA